ncbi:hypothetical protein ABZP36_032917 [Zizania latifolia]
MRGPWRVVEDSAEASEAATVASRMATATESTWIWRSELGNEAAMRPAAQARRSGRERSSGRSSGEGEGGAAAGVGGRDGESGRNGNESARSTRRTGRRQRSGFCSGLLG